MKLVKRALSFLSMTAMLATLLVSSLPLDIIAAGTSSTLKMTADSSGYVFFDTNSAKNVADVSATAGSPVLSVETVSADSASGFTGGTAYQAVLNKKSEEGITLSGFSLAASQYKAGFYAIEGWVYVASADYLQLTVKLYNHTQPEHVYAQTFTVGQQINFNTNAKLQAGWNYFFVPLSVFTDYSFLNLSNWEELALDTLSIYQAATTGLANTLAVASFRLTATTMNSWGSPWTWNNKNPGTSGLTYNTSAVDAGDRTTMGGTATSTTVTMYKYNCSVTALTARESAHTSLVFDWYYDGTNKPVLIFEINSNGATKCDNAEMEVRYYTANAVADGLASEGWNHVEIPIGSAIQTAMLKAYNWIRLDHYAMIRTQLDDGTLFNPGNISGFRVYTTNAVSGAIIMIGDLHLEVTETTADTTYQGTVSLMSASDSKSITSSVRALENQVYGTDTSRISVVDVTSLDASTTLSGTAYQVQFSSSKGKNGLILNNLNWDTSLLKDKYGHADLTDSMLTMWVYSNDWSQGTIVIRLGEKNVQAAPDATSVIENWYLNVNSTGNYFYINDDTSALVSLKAKASQINGKWTKISIPLTKLSACDPVRYAADVTNSLLIEDHAASANSTVAIAQVAIEQHQSVGGTATCAKKAVCSICGASYGEYSSVHTLTYHAAVATTCQKEGNIAYYTCSVCGKYFSDAAGTNEIAASSVAVAKLPHSSSASWSCNETQHWRVCDTCGTTETANHEYDYDFSSTCNVCGYVTASAKTPVKVSADQTAPVDCPALIQTTYVTDDVVVADVVICKGNGYAVDPTGVSDSTAAINAALNACYQNGGGTVFLPEGTYRITGTITIPDFVTLRGDWQDPDEGQNYGTVFLMDVAELSSESELTTGTLSVGGSSGLVGVTIYYPNQSIDDVKIYPYAIMARQKLLATIENVTLINAYAGVYTPTTLAHEQLNIRNLKGTCLKYGLDLANSADVDVYTDITLNATYWANAARGWNTASLSEIKAYTLANGTGIRGADLEWAMLTYVSVDSFNIGFHVALGSRYYLSGSADNLSITNCNYGIYLDNATYNTSKMGLDYRWGMTLSSSTIQGSTYSLYDASYTGSTTNHGAIKMTDTTLSGSTKAYTITDSTGSSLAGCTIDLSAANQKPAARMIALSLTAYQNAAANIAPLVQAALDEMATQGGGIVYLPAGKYLLSSPLTVPAGVELRGASSVTQRDQSGLSLGTILLTDYGAGASSPDTATALITLNGDYAGVTGLRVMYYNNRTTITNGNVVTYPYTIRGKGTGVYAINTGIVAAYNGVDFSDCDEHVIRGLMSFCVSHTMVVGGENGIVFDCLQNPTVMMRTGTMSGYFTQIDEKKESGNLPVIYGLTHANNQYLTLQGTTNERVSSIFIYGGRNFLIGQKDVNTLVINASSDTLGGTGYQTTLTGSVGFTLINALRYSATSSSGSFSGTSSYYRVYNRLTINTRTESNAVYGVIDSHLNYVTSASGLVEVRDNGILLKEGTDYTLSSQSTSNGKITFTITGAGNYKSSATVTLPLLATPKTPTAAAQEDGIAVSWRAVSGATAYRVYRTAGNGSTRLIATTSELSWIDTAVNADTTYTYAIEAVAGQVSSTRSKGSGTTTDSTPQETPAITSGAPTMASDDNGFVFYTAGDDLSTYTLSTPTGTLPVVSTESGILPDGSTPYAAYVVDLGGAQAQGVQWTSQFSLSFGQYQPSQYAWDFWLYIADENGDENVPSNLYLRLDTNNDYLQNNSIRPGQVVNYLTGETLKGGWNHVFIPMSYVYYNKLYTETDWQSLNLTKVRLWQANATSTAYTYKVANLRLTQCDVQAYGSSENANYEQLTSNDYTAAALEAAGEQGLKNVAVYSGTNSGATFLVTETNTASWTALTAEDFVQAKMRVWYYYDPSASAVGQVQVEVANSTSRTDAAEIQYSINLATMIADGALTAGWNQIEFPMFPYGTDTLTYLNNNSLAKLSQSTTAIGLLSSETDPSHVYIRLASFNAKGGTFDPQTLKRLSVFIQDSATYNLALADFEIVVDREETGDNSLVAFDAASSKSASDMTGYNSPSVATVGTIGTDLPAATVEGGPTTGTAYLVQASGQKSGAFINNINLDLTPLYNDPDNYELYVWMYIDDFSKVSHLLTRWYSTNATADSARHIFQFGSKIGANMSINGEQVSTTLETSAKPSGWFRLSWKLSDMIQSASNFQLYGDVPTTLRSILLADWSAGTETLAIAEVGLEYTGSDRVDNNTTTVINSEATQMTVRYTADKATTLQALVGDKVVASREVKAGTNQTVRLSVERYLEAGETVTFAGTDSAVVTVSRYADQVILGEKALYYAPVTAQVRTTGALGLRFNFGIDIAPGGTFTQGGKTYTVSRIGALIIPTSALGETSLSLSNVVNGKINGTNVADIRVTAATRSEAHYTNFAATVINIPASAKGQTLTAVSYVVTQSGQIFYGDTVEASVDSVIQLLG